GTLRCGWMTPETRSLLEAAAILHDVGYSINYAGHHKHSYHLIMHSDLAGWTHRELEIVANVARYHRRAAPKKSHANFAALEKEDRALVRGLSAILCITDGLDRAHAQNVQRVGLRIESREAKFVVTAHTLPEVDIWGASRKSELFREVFGLTP